MALYGMPRSLVHVCVQTSRVTLRNSVTNEETTLMLSKEQVRSAVSVLSPVQACRQVLWLWASATSASAERQQPPMTHWMTWGVHAPFLCQGVG